MGGEHRDSEDGENKHGDNGGTIKRKGRKRKPERRWRTHPHVPFVRALGVKF